MQRVRERTRKRKGRAFSGKLPPELAELMAARRPYQPVAPAVKVYGLQLLRDGEQSEAVAHLVGVCVRTIEMWRSETGLTQPRKGRPEQREMAVLAVPPGSASMAKTQASVLGADEDRPEVSESASDDASKQLCITSGLSPLEIAATMELKRRHPSMQPAQLCAQLKRFKGWRLSLRAVARVLKANGYELVHTGSRPVGQENPTRFEAPYRNALWQLDFVELRVGDERTPLLLVLDDFSRFVVAFELMSEPTSEKVVEVLKRAIRQHGRPEAIYTDRGGPFLAWREQSSLGRFLDEQLIDHHVSRPYKPQGRGKVEALAHTVRRELWDVEHFGSPEEACEGLRRFFVHYNHGRAHLGIDGLTPADRYFGRWEEVKARVEHACRRREGALLYGAAAGALPYADEVSESGGCLDVLRFVVVDGKMEIRLFGHRVVVGPVNS